jgi:hypothetical protein
MKSELHILRQRVVGFFREHGLQADMGASTLSRNTVRGVLCALVAAGLGWLAPDFSHAAVLYTEEFSTDPAWVASPGGSMTVAHTADFGHGGLGSLKGSFAAVGGPPVLQSGAFRATASSSGGAFTGDYWADVAGWSGWRFSFYADALPMGLQLRLNGNSWTTFFNVLPQITSPGNWNSVFVPSVYSAGWAPLGNQNNWSNALLNVTYAEVQVSRIGSDAQSFYLDDFEIVMNDPPLSGAVPEPASMLLLGLGGVAAYTARRQMRKGLAKRSAG